MSVMVLHLICIKSTFEFLKQRLSITIPPISRVDRSFSPQDSKQKSKHNPQHLSIPTPITAETTSITAPGSSRGGCGSSGPQKRKSTYNGQPKNQKRKRDYNQESKQRPEGSNGSYEHDQDSIYYEYPETGPQYNGVIWTQQNLQMDTVIGGLGKEYLVVDGPGGQGKREHDEQRDHMVGEFRGEGLNERNGNEGPDQSGNYKGACSFGRGRIGAAVAGYQIGGEITGICGVFQVLQNHQRDIEERWKRPVTGGV